MTDACRFVSSTEPRILPGRHEEDCASTQCDGCLRCTLTHCRCCGVKHSVGASPGCVGETRDNLAEILDLCTNLWDEALNKGTNSEAATLLGGAADPEARGHLTASVMAGRINPDYLGVIPRDKHGNELPDHTPLWVLGKWAMLYRDAFEHDEPVYRATEWTEGSYLDRNLAYAATFEHVQFEDMAADLRSCLAHLKSVLHDEDRGVRANVPCFDCGQDIERRLSDNGFEDHWTCRGCRRRYTIAEYNFALRAVLESEEAAS